MLELAIRAPVQRADLPGLYARACALLAHSGASLIRCDVTAVDADAVAVDGLARLHLAAQRHGCELRLVGASPQLRALVAFMGLGETLALDASPPDAPAGRTAGTATRSPGRT